VLKVAYAMHDPYSASVEGDIWPVPSHFHFRSMRPHSVLSSFRLCCSTWIVMLSSLHDCAVFMKSQCESLALGKEAKGPAVARVNADHA